MFCVNCGNQIRDDQNFCAGCGAAVKRGPVSASVGAPPQPPVPVQAAPVAYVAAPPEPEPAVQFSGGKCSWCGGTIGRGQTSCPRCGASLSMPEEISKSGWAQLPG